MGGADVSRGETRVAWPLIPGTMNRERQSARLIAVPISFRTYDAVFRADLAYLDRLEVNWFRYNSLFASVPTD